MFVHLQGLGIIHPPCGKKALLLHMAPKANGEWQPCRNYRKLSLVSVPNLCLVLHIQVYATSLARATIFLSQLDPQVPSGSCPPQICAQNDYYYTLWFLFVLVNAIQALEFSKGSQLSLCTENPR